MKEVTTNDFKKEVLEEKNLTVLVDFWAPWCPPCRAQTPILESFEKDASEKVKILKLNVDENQEIAQQYGVMNIPTLLVFKKGELSNKAVGLQNNSQLKKLTGI